jgi:hypothetical protein
MDLNFKRGQRPNYLQGVQISEEKKRKQTNNERYINWKLNEYIRIHLTGTSQLFRKKLFRD